MFNIYNKLRSLGLIKISNSSFFAVHVHLFHWLNNNFRITIRTNINFTTCARKTVATGSVRRRAQLVTVRPDLKFVELRGNIHTRLEKIPHNGSIVMAIAAMQVLGITDKIAEELATTEFVPMVGQGCVAVECREGDSNTLAAIAGVDHARTRFAVEIERAFLAELGAGCSMPVGAYVNEANVLSTFMATGPTISDRHVKYVETVPSVDAHEFARELARKSQSALA